MNYKIKANLNQLLIAGKKEFNSIKKMKIFMIK